jgi:hypothetical protein
MPPIELSVPTEDNDPLIDELRLIRRGICERVGHDIDLLASELRQVALDYAERKGVFSNVSEAAAEQVQASWGDMSRKGDDLMVDEIRTVRTGFISGGRRP